VTESAAASWTVVASGTPAPTLHWPQSTQQGRATDPTTQLIPLAAQVTITGDRSTVLLSPVLVPADRVTELWETHVCRSNNNLPVRTRTSRIVDPSADGPFWDSDLGGPWTASQTELTGSQTTQPQVDGVDLEFRSTLQQN
jgi:hypothetical protein